MATSGADSSRLARDEERGAPVVVYLDATKTSLWGPELVHYNVEHVPTFIVLDSRDGKGHRRVVGKTSRVDSEEIVLKGLERLLNGLT